MSALSLDGHGDGVAAAETKRGDTLLRILTNQFVDQRDQDASAAGADGMPNGDSSTVHVDLVGIEAEFALHAECLDGEGFVQFKEVDLIALPACFL